MQLEIFFKLITTKSQGFGGAGLCVHQGSRFTYLIHEILIRRKLQRFTSPGFK